MIFWIAFEICFAVSKSSLQGFLLLKKETQTYLLNFLIGILFWLFPFVIISRKQSALWARKSRWKRQVFKLNFLSLLSLLQLVPTWSILPVPSMNTLQAMTRLGARKSFRDMILSLAHLKSFPSLLTDLIASELSLSRIGSEGVEAKSLLQKVTIFCLWKWCSLRFLQLQLLVGWPCFFHHFSLFFCFSCSFFN